MFRGSSYDEESSSTSIKTIILVIMIFIIGSFFVFSYMNPLPNTKSTLEHMVSKDIGAMKSTIMDCEENSLASKIYLADLLREMTDLKQKIEDAKSSNNELIIEKKDDKDLVRLLVLEKELNRVKKLYAEIREQTEGVSLGIDQVVSVNDDVMLVIRNPLEVVNYVPHSDYYDEVSSPSYSVTENLQCWAKDCSPDILNNKEAYADCQIASASTWNTIGVKHMEKFVSLPKNYPTLSDRQTHLLQSAVNSFQKAIDIDPDCSHARANLAIALLQQSKDQQALEQMDIVHKKNAETLRNLVIYGFILDYREDRDRAMDAWKKALELDPMIGERKYYGIMVVDDTVPERHIQFPTIHEIHFPHEKKVALDILTYIEFSPVSIANYAIIPPGTPEFFAENKYIILRDMIPPFVLRSVANCFESLQRDGILSLGDHQSKRYNAYNTRAGRSLHYQIVDVIRRVLLHNVQPTYDFYGGYIGGAVLPPHTDKPQCEFTVTLTLSQYPEGSDPWAISLGNHAKFDRDDEFIGSSGEPLPPEDEIVDANLYPGDLLLFMGRHLVHFRRTPLPESQTLQQIFFHHVQDDFEGIYDI